MKISFSVTSELFSSTVRSEIDDPIKKTFDPLMTTDIPLIGLLTRELPSTSPTVEIVVKERKEVAESMAKELTEMILKVMREQDTHNGYRKVG